MTAFVLKVIFLLSMYTNFIHTWGTGKVQLYGLAQMRGLSDSFPYRRCSPLFAGKTSILGENLIECRDFSLATTKVFEYVNSYKTLNSMPHLGLPEFAFIGRSNVGKSTLINTLTGTSKKVATAGKTPGTTKCINLFSCKDKSGPICNFVDLPGYGFAKLSKVEQQEISSFLRDYFLARGALKLVFLLVDSRREGNALDQEMFSFLADHGVPVVIVATKVDKLSKGEAGKALEHLRSAYGALSAAASQRQRLNTYSHDGDADDGADGAIIGHDEVSCEVPIIMFSSVTEVGKSEIWRSVKDNMLYSY